MEISIKTKVSFVIKHNIEAINAIASINPHFEKLRNPILRRLLAPRITLEEAAKIGKCDVSLLMEKLKKIGFTVAPVAKIPTQNNVLIENNTNSKPINQHDHVTITIDVHEMLNRNEDPFNLIMENVRQLEQTQQLQILSPFEPIPLIRILSTKGFDCKTKEDSGIYSTTIQQSSSFQELLKEPESNQVTQGQLNMMVQQFLGKIEELDVREMEMPEPMISILEKLTELPLDSALFVHHKKIPHYLLPELDSRNFNYHIHCVDDFNVELLIHSKN